MMKETGIKQIFDASILDISKRVGKLEVIESYDGDDVEFEAPYTVFVTTNGDFQEVFSFSADKTVLETIATNMMHGANVSEESMKYCAVEFFNILCGQVISSINRTYKTKTRISVPSFAEDMTSKSEGRRVWKQLVYCYSCGKAKFEISNYGK